MAEQEYLEVRPEWLSRVVEEALEPDLPIVDSHHHLWDIPGWQYMLPEYLEDLRGGHRVVSTVFMQCYSMFRAGGPRELRSLGETEFANGIAAQTASGIYGESRVCDGIVGYVNLALGAAAGDVLEKHMAAAGARFKGVRHIVAWSPDEHVQSTKGPPAHLMQNPEFLEGFACLEKLNLSFDAMVFHTQLKQLENLARAFPGTQIVLNHVGVPLGIASFAGRRDQVFEDWSRGMAGLAQCPNVTVKLGGLGMKLAGFDFHTAKDPPSSTALADAWRPYVDKTIQIFGPSRCMFESNFPVDKGSCSFNVMWNAFKRIVGDYSQEDKRDMFSGTASRIYKLQLNEG